MRLIALGYVIALGAGLGLASAHLAVAGRPLVGKVEIGAWTVWPRGGARDADPYMRAFLSRGPHLPLAAGEGLDLIAERDGDGTPLIGRCRYTITGVTPATRSWTLTVADREGRPLTERLGRATMTDAEILRTDEEPMRIVASAAPAAGNWLPIPENDRFTLRLRLYDTPVSSHAASLSPTLLPLVQRIDCR